MENIFEENKSKKDWIFFLICEGPIPGLVHIIETQLKLVVNYLHFCYLESGGLVSFYLLKL